jgi:hypothetical protein
MAKKRIYIYGIVPNFYSPDIYRSLDNSGVYTISFQNESAIVSDRDDLSLDILDRESLGRLLVHHQRMIEDLQGKGFTMIIPMRLGTSVDSKEEVIKILANGHDLIIETLKKIEYLTEIDLVVTWDKFNEELASLANQPDILEKKKWMMDNNNIITEDDQYKMGMFVQEKLLARNKDVELKILDALSPFGLDIKKNEVMNDQMITNTAFLINRDKRENFEMIIDQLDEEFNGLLSFKLVGPLPCYSFYTLEVKELNPALVALAKTELGLKEETSVSEIKKAYLEKARISHPDSQNENKDEEDFNRVNRAYHTMLDYSAAVRQSSKEDFISLLQENIEKNMILVKLKN